MQCAVCSVQGNLLFVVFWISVQEQTGEYLAIYNVFAILLVVFAVFWSIANLQSACAIF